MATIGGSCLERPRQRACRRAPRIAIVVVAALLGAPSFGQQSEQSPVQQSPQDQPTPAPTPPGATSQTNKKDSDKQINVSWLYGAYIPKDVPLVSLNGKQRVHLWVRATFTTYGIYFKTAFFSLSDQINNHPPAWGDGWAGYGKRVASRQGQFVIQNSLSALGNGLLGYEPRYNRCRCDGFWHRTGHAVARNFVTYDRTETKIRLQIPLYAAAFGAGVVAGTWTPNHDLLTTGGHGALNQAGFGILANAVGEFWPDIEHIWKHKKPGHAATGKNP
jgi:hypothetical protein